MELTCPICNKKISRDLTAVLTHQDEHVIEEIKKEYPYWVSQDGLCIKCYQYYKNQVRPDKF